MNGLFFNRAAQRSSRSTSPPTHTSHPETQPVGTFYSTCVRMLPRVCDVMRVRSYWPTTPGGEWGLAFQGAFLLERALQCSSNPTRCDPPPLPDAAGPATAVAATAGRMLPLVPAIIPVRA